MTTFVEYSEAQTRFVPAPPPIGTYRGFQETPRSAPPRSLITEAVVGGKRRPLAKLVAVTLTAEAEGWFAENEGLNLFGSGDTPLAAIENFRQHLEHLIEHYRSLRWDEVIGEGSRLKTLCESLVSRDAD